MQGINSKEIKNPKIKNYGKIIESWMLDPKDRNNKDLCKDKNQEVVILRIKGKKKDEMGSNNWWIDRPLWVPTWRIR